MSSTIFTDQKVMDPSSGRLRKGEGENSPISPPLDPRLGWEELGAELVTKAVTHKAQLSKQTANMATKAVLHLR